MKKQEVDVSNKGKVERERGERMINQRIITSHQPNGGACWIYNNE